MCVCVCGKNEYSWEIRVNIIGHLQVFISQFNSNSKRIEMEPMFFHYYFTHAICKERNIHHGASSHIASHATFVDGNRSFVGLYVLIPFCIGMHAYKLHTDEDCGRGGAHAHRE